MAKKPRQPKANASAEAWKRFETKIDEYNKKRALVERIKAKARKY